MFRPGLGFVLCLVDFFFCACVCGAGVLEHLTGKPELNSQNRLFIWQYLFSTLKKKKKSLYFGVRSKIAN